MKETQSMDDQIAEAERESSTTKSLVLAFCILVTALLGMAGYTIFTYVKRNNAYKKALKAAKDETDQDEIKKFWIQSIMPKESKQPFYQITKKLKPVFLIHSFFTSQKTLWPETFTGW